MLGGSDAGRRKKRRMPVRQANPFVRATKIRFCIMCRDDSQSSFLQVENTPYWPIRQRLYRLQ